MWSSRQGSGKEFRKCGEVDQGTGEEFRRFAVEDQGGEEFMVQSAGESVSALVTS